MRATTAFKRLMDLPGVTVTDVDFQPAKVVVRVRLRRSKLSCPACGFTTRARYDTRPVSSAWRHLDLGRWRLEVGPTSVGSTARPMEPAPRRSLRPGRFPVHP